ncbi:hypothetical protein [Ammoniphilus sp. CFH 90114]|uniref:hypothetical protein n=1 Tax=Ammoniphilus sp. CFH 90114 TaxID=2493665 RepID=UPI00100DF9DB|nr:hypothetical protein [Ammoniphilus sp. CFH 90114]RXT15319.1 hypothetical protein EIZ39_03685 [Ammoniphilus sp. CFH 90114]
MNYNIKVKELDEGTNYPLIVLSGMTGLGQKTIQELAEQGNFSMISENGQQVVKGKEFLDWAKSVDNQIEVEKNDYHLMDVEDR